MVTIQEPNISFINYEDLIEHITSYDLFDPNKHLINTKFIISLETRFSGNADMLKTTPTRTNCLRVGLVTAGWLKPIVNTREYDIGKGDLIFMNWGTVVASFNKEEDAIIRGFAISEDYIRTTLADQIPNSMKNPRLSFKITLTQHDRNIFDYYLRGFLKLSNIVHDPESNIYKCLFSSLLYFLDSLCVGNEQAPEGKKNSKTHLVELFLLMVCDNRQRQYDIEYYAARLCVSSNYLCTVVRQKTGETVKSWIDHSLINNIKFQLKYTQKPLKHISHEFGFESLSSFCKFFKRMESITANAYRNMPSHT